MKTLKDLARDAADKYYEKLSDERQHPARYEGYQDGFLAALEHPSQVEGDLVTLKESMINNLEKHGDEKMVVIGSHGAFSGKELAEQIRNNTEIGHRQISCIVLLAVDLLRRGKIGDAHAEQEAIATLQWLARTPKANDSLMNGHYQADQLYHLFKADTAKNQKG